MHKILVHSPSRAEGETIKNMLEKHLPFSVALSMEKIQLEDDLMSRSTHLLIFNTRKFFEPELEFIKRIKEEHSFDQPILASCDKVRFANFMHLCDKHKLFFLEKPFSGKALAGLARKLLVARSVGQQVHRRFLTNQKTVIETFSKGQSLESNMLNLSKGGAYFEFGQEALLDVGELVRMKVSLEDVEREYSMNARVVWTSKHDSESFCAGVQFVKNADIYRELMDKM